MIRDIEWWFAPGYMIQLIKQAANGEKEMMPI